MLTQTLMYTHPIVLHVYLLVTMSLYILISDSLDYTPNIAGLVSIPGALGLLGERVNDRCNNNVDDLTIMTL